MLQSMSILIAESIRPPGVRISRFAERRFPGSGALGCLFFGVLGVGQVIARREPPGRRHGDDVHRGPDDLCPGIRGGGARIGDGWGMGSARRVRGGRWPVVTLMFLVLWA
jgi:hypothetical protein